MACRPVLSVFNAVYRFIECAKGRQFTLWRSAARELLLVTFAGHSSGSQMDLLMLNT